MFGMSERVELTVDRQRRMSVGRLGFSEGHVVAEPLEDGSGWVVRPAVLMTDAEIDILTSPKSVEDIERSLGDLAEGNIRPRAHSRG